MYIRNRSASNQEWTTSIYITLNIDKTIMKIMIEHPEIKTMKHGPSYDPKDNIISLVSKSDEDIINDLIHELIHWSQFMFLNETQLNNTLQVYNKEASNEKIPFLERIII